MCLSTVYETHGEERKLVAEYVSSISADEGTVTLTDIMGRETVVKGTVSNMDFVKNIILIKAC